MMAMLCFGACWVDRVDVDDAVSLTAAVDDGSLAAAAGDG